MNAAYHSIEYNVGWHSKNMVREYIAVAKKHGGVGSPVKRWLFVFLLT